jgi:hypothetical protein
MLAVGQRIVAAIAAISTDAATRKSKEEEKGSYWM